MSTPQCQELNSMPTQLRNLFMALPSECYRDFADLFSVLPQGFCTLFKNHFVSVLTSVCTTLPPVLAFPPSENPALFPNLPTAFRRFTSLLTIILGTAFTTVTLIDSNFDLGALCYGVLASMNTAMYVNPSPDLHTLLNTLLNPVDDVLIYLPGSPMYRALTNFPFELYLLLNSPPPLGRHPLSTELSTHLSDLVLTMGRHLDNIVNDLNEELLGNQHNNSTAANYDLNSLTVLYVYHARGDVSDECSVCLLEMKDGDNARRLGCSHFFHVQCIDRWLKTKRSCPLCRTPIDTTHD